MSRPVSRAPLGNYTPTATDHLDRTSPPGTAGAVTVDTRAPTASMGALDPYHDQGSVTVGWGGSDPAPGTGVSSNDVQHRWESDGWQTISMTTVMTEATYAVAEGTHWFRVRARDGAGNEGSYTTAISTVVDLTAPTLSLVSIEEASAYAHVQGDQVTYGAGSGTFTVTVQAGDPSPPSAQAAGLVTVSFPETVSAGAVYSQSGAYSATVAHAYTLGDFRGGPLHSLIKLRVVLSCTMLWILFCTQSTQKPFLDRSRDCCAKRGFVLLTSGWAVERACHRPRKSP